MDPTQFALMGAQAAHTARQTEPPGRRDTAFDQGGFAQAYDAQGEGGSDPSGRRPGDATGGKGDPGDSRSVARETGEDAELGQTANRLPKTPLTDTSVGAGHEPGGDAPSMARESDKTHLARAAGGATETGAETVVGSLIGASTPTGPEPPHPRKAVSLNPITAPLAPVRRTPDTVRATAQSPLQAMSATPSVASTWDEGNAPLGKPAPPLKQLGAAAEQATMMPGRAQMPAGDNGQVKPPFRDGSFMIADTGKPSAVGSDATQKTVGVAQPHGLTAPKTDKAPAVAKGVVAQAGNLPPQDVGTDGAHRRGTMPTAPIPAPETAPDQNTRTAVAGAQKIGQPAQMLHATQHPDGWRGQAAGKDMAKDTGKDKGAHVMAANHANAPDSAPLTPPREQMSAPAAPMAHPAVAPLPDHRVPAADAVQDLTGGEIAPGDAPRGERSLPALTDAGPPPRPDIGRSVSAQIADVIRTNADGRIDVTLRPEDLGRLSLSFSSDGASMSVSLTADRPETLDLIRRNLDLLAQELRDMGYETFQFDFGSHDRRDTEDGGDPASGAQPTEPAEGPADGPARAPAPVGASGMEASGGMDLRL